MNQKVEQIEAESEASTELGGELAGDTLQQKFKKLEGGTGGDMALAELKAKMGLGPAPERPALAERGQRRADGAHRRQVKLSAVARRIETLLYEIPSKGTTERWHNIKITRQRVSTA